MSKIELCSTSNTSGSRVTGKEEYWRHSLNKTVLRSKQHSFSPIKRNRRTLSNKIPLSYNCNQSLVAPLNPSKQKASSKSPPYRYMAREEEKRLSPEMRHSTKKLSKNCEAPCGSPQKALRSRKLSVNLPPIAPPALPSMELDFSTIARRSNTMYQSGKIISKNKTIKRSLIAEGRDIGM